MGTTGHSVTISRFTARNTVAPDPDLQALRRERQISKVRRFTPFLRSLAMYPLNHDLNVESLFGGGFHFNNGGEIVRVH